MSENWKETNPKDAIGTGKLPMHLIPRTAKAALALAFAEGAMKYGKFNWRVAGVRSSIYLDAIERHLDKFVDGEWSDEETMVPHLASVMACCAIILDADANDKLTDDRPPVSIATTEIIDSAQGNLKHLRELFEEYNPHQYTIMDTGGQSFPFPEELPPNLLRGLEISTNLDDVVHLNKEEE
jgi:hypothetical protein